MSDQARKNMIEINKVYNADALDILRQIPDNSIDLILTDPPFMISQEIKIFRGGNSKFKGKDIDLDFGAWDKQWKSMNDYLEWCKLWLKEAVRVLKDYRHLVFFYDIRKISYVVDYLESLNMKYRGNLLWIKSNPTPQARKVKFQRAVEYALWFTKSKIYSQYFNYKYGQSPEYVIAGLPNSNRIHPAQKPVKVLEHWIKYFSDEGDIVLDPFAGSGSTIVASINLNRNYIGIERDKDFHEKILERIKTLQIRLGI
ncbi:MAG: site-specific DNA-methyltransferase [Candidatus Aenigmatarchaeota archaeon]